MIFIGSSGYDDHRPQAKVRPRRPPETPALPSQDLPDTLCPIARSTSRVGDKWSLLIIRELFMGVSRFQDLLAQTGATPQLLTARLKQLQADGLIERRAYSERPLRFEYRLTAMGLDLMPIILAFRAWGETWCKTPEEGVAVRMFHNSCRTELELDGRCPTCGVTVPWTETHGLPNPAYLEERMQRAAAAARSVSEP
ncbi:winged helix-turn-helix transcriptional regulator [Phenylobacterium aquaticum]|uniref:winged helix-turn-helix transcriptional regulator n=1 Tax=Phenylobacterium aquaticum TaxID=1763816 RepID=UPI001F5CFA2B|nr:helix-turn-helix domain-containing protein [Phenylobacterium aquaticum]MCI3132364.1 helix-turn-helix transcriptional regulator [Phenylobacterium aquaticum]